MEVALSPLIFFFRFNNFKPRSTAFTWMKGPMGKVLCSV